MKNNKKFIDFNGGNYDVFHLDKVLKQFLQI